MINGILYHFIVSWTKLCATDPYALAKSSQDTTISLAFCLASRSVSINACVCLTQPAIPGKNLSEWLGLMFCTIQDNRRFASTWKNIFPLTFVKVIFLNRSSLDLSEMLHQFSMRGGFPFFKTLLRIPCITWELLNTSCKSHKE